jgi:hypothetical protein
MTAHSPVGLDPEGFGVKKANDNEILFADNDVEHIDPSGADHALFAYGLKKSLFNYMHGLGMDEPLGKWFEFKIPKTTIDSNFILSILNDEIPKPHSPHTRVVFTGPTPKIEIVTKSKKGNQWELAVLEFEGQSETVEIKVDKENGARILNYSGITNQSISYIKLGCFIYDLRSLLINSKGLLFCKRVQSTTRSEIIIRIVFPQ